MNKLEFLTRLRNCLERGGMNTDDINDALTYYEEVFLDAGFGKEEETAAAMGSPEEVAMNILRESGIQVSAPVFPIQPQPVPVGAPVYQAPVKDKSSTENRVLKIVLAVVTFPFWLPVLIVAVSMLFALIVTAIAVAFSLIVTGGSLIAGGIAAMFMVPCIGLMLTGAGLIVTGLLVLLLKPVFRVVIPACGKAVKSAFRRVAGLFKKEEN